MYKQTIELENDWFKEKSREEDGLHLLIIGGTHGNESNAVKMVSEFLRKLNPKNEYGIHNNKMINTVRTSLATVIFVGKFINQFLLFNY